MINLPGAPDGKQILLIDDDANLLVALHHMPSRTRDQRLNILTSLHLANALAHHATARDPEELLPKLDQDYIQQLGLADHLKALQNKVSVLAGQRQ